MGSEDGQLLGTSKLRQLMWRNSQPPSFLQSMANSGVSLVTNCNGFIASLLSISCCTFLQDGCTWFAKAKNCNSKMESPTTIVHFFFFNCSISSAFGLDASANFGLPMAFT